LDEKVTFLKKLIRADIFISKLKIELNGAATDPSIIFLLGVATQQGFNQNVSCILIARNVFDY